MFDGIAQDVHLMQFEKGKLIVVVDENDKVRSGFLELSAYESLRAS
jgi:hypothetical protein